MYTLLYTTIEGDSYSIVVATVSDSMATVVALQLRMAQVDKLLSEYSFQAFADTRLI